MIVTFSLLRSKYIKPNDKHTQDALHIFAKNAPAHMHNITMLNSIENQLYKIDAEDHIPKNISSTKIESILKCNQSETGELASTLQIKLNARVMRSSHQRSSIKKGVLRNFTKFTGKDLCQSLFFNKVAGLWDATLVKKRLWHRYFPVNFVKFSKNTFFTEHLWTTASESCLP